MSRVEEIKAAIERLSFEERCELNAWLNPQPQDDWDIEMQADTAAGGKLRKLIREAESDASSGHLRDFPGREKK